MTLVEVPSGTQLGQTWLGGRFRLDERISVSEHIDGTCGVSAEARMLYALLTGCWPGTEATALLPAPRYKGQVHATPGPGRVPAILDVITYRALQGQAPDAPARPLPAAGLALALRGVQRPHPAGRTSRGHVLPAGLGHGECIPAGT